MAASASSLARAPQAGFLTKCTARREMTPCRFSGAALSARTPVRLTTLSGTALPSSRAQLLGRPLLPRHSTVTGRGRTQRLACPRASVLPALVLAFVEAELPEKFEIVQHFNDYHITEPIIKTFYLIFTCIFCWGACVFGSMNETFYDTDEYRDAGGNGTQFFRYQMEEEAEQANREELWADDLRKEIEGRGLDVKELGEAKEEDKEKEKELV